jgi:MYXO-CTERM domain-containing protein
VQRATDIPTTLIELLVSDDDDGNLANGTPHECTIRTAFGKHGLRTVLGNIDAPGAFEAPVAQVTQPVALTLRGLATNCTGDAIDKLTVYWKGKGGTPAPGNMEAVVVTPVANGVGEWTADVPLARNGIVEFKAELLFKDGTYLTLPDNQGDPLYQMFEGKTVPLYCTDFEQDPFAAGWTTSASKNAPVFEWGNPAVAARLSATDPTAAFSGANILAQGLGKEYLGDSTSGAESPVIDLGRYSNVRLQYRRWLAIEDGHFDKARIIANGNVVWNNYDSNKGDSSSVHTIDREWRFVDLPLAKLIRGHTLKLGFDLTSDAGLHLGGWQIDDLCVVADPTSICGDGVVSPSEQCDDGPDNADTPDACHTDCFLAACGDGILDTGEECDGGSADSFACDNECKSKISVGGGGLCSTSKGTSGATWLLALLGVGLGLRRRRR